MLEVDLVEHIGWIVCGGLVVVLLAERIKVPSIVAYIVAGLLLGPVFGVIDVPDMGAGNGHDPVHLIAEFGIALLLFVVGLELSLDKIRDVGKVAVIAGLGQVIFTALGGLGLSLLLGFELLEAVFLAVALTFSSTVVVVKLLDQKGDLDSLYGRIAVGIFLVQDMVVIAALTLLAGMAGTEGDVDVMTMAGDIGIAFVGTAALLVVALVAARWLLPKPFEWAARRPDTLFLWSLCWCFLFVFASEAMDLSLEIGAFLAGLSLAQLPYNDDLRRRVHPLMNFFIAVFFVSLGLQMELQAALDNIWPSIALALFVLVGNPLIFMIIITLNGYDEETSFSTSVTVAQISEFSFIFATMGLAAGLIGDEILSVVALVGLVTIAVSSYMILYTEPLYKWIKNAGLLKIFGAAGRDKPTPEPPISDHVIVVGMNSLGQALVNRLCADGETVIAIDTDASKLDDLPCKPILGNVIYKSVTDAANLSGAKLLVSTLHIEDTNRLLAYRARELEVPTAIHAFDPSVIDDLKELNVDRLIEPRRDGVEREWESLGRSLRGEEQAHD